MTERRVGRSCTTATARLKQDYIRLMKDPVPYVAAAPLPSNILEWHYVVTGPEETPYEGGLYHGKLIFPSQFPFKPPSIYMITPSGRFKTNTRLCLSISDFHPDTWNPAWTVGSILTGLVSFMVETTPTLGSIETTTQSKRAFALNSLEFNLRNETFCLLFPETAAFIREQLTPAGNGDKAGEETELLEGRSGEMGEANLGKVQNVPNDDARREATGFIGGQNIEKKKEKEARGKDSPRFRCCFAVQSLFCSRGIAEEDH